MKLNKAMIGVFTFSAVILGAITSSQTAKADSVSDASQVSSESVETPESNSNSQSAVGTAFVPAADNNVSATASSSADSSAVASSSAVSAPASVSSSGSSDVSASGSTNLQQVGQDGQNDQVVYNALPSSDSTGESSSVAGTTNAPSVTVNTNGGEWGNDVVYSRPQDNFYMYENGDWVNETSVDDVTPVAGSFNDVSAAVNQKVENAFNQLSDGMDSAGTAMDEATWFYQLTQNDDLSNVGVITPDLAQEINGLLNLSDMSELNGDFTNEIGRDQPTPFSILVARDQNDPTKNAIYLFGAQPLMLTDQGIAASEEDTVVAFLQLAGYSNDMIQNIITGTVNYDQLLMNTLSQDDLNATTQIGGGYKQVSLNDLINSSNSINFNGILHTLTGEHPDYVYEMTPSYFENIQSLINPSVLNDLKGWMVSNLILYRASELQDIVSGFQNFLQTTHPDLSRQYLESSGDLTPALQRELAYYLTTQAFKDGFSQYYGPSIITPEEKDAVTTLTKKIIYSYSTQIINSTWLDNETKRNALGKLSRLKINIGYPTKDFDYFNRVDIEGYNSAYTNYRNLVGAQALQNLADYSQPVDRSAWIQGQSALDANASYNRLNNSITIDAGIINSPFFSLDNTESQNLGGLGVIIGHELTHAFDANGSLYDGNGELHDWWSSDDLARFNQLVGEFENEYNGIPYDGGYVNGEQTVDENIADNGGLNVALATLESEKNYDLKQFFDSYALGWRSKYTPDMQQAQLSDVHTPDSLRVNVSLQNIGAFYDAFDVQPGDGMYLAPDKRVNIW